MNTMAPFKIPVRSLVCALAACLLTVVLLAGISQGPAEQAAQRTVLLQA
jgi:hypothetical protein